MRGCSDDAVPDSEFGGFGPELASIVSIVATTSTNDLGLRLIMRSAFEGVELRRVDFDDLAVVLKTFVEGRCQARAHRDLRPHGHSFLAVNRRESCLRPNSNQLSVVLAKLCDA